MTEPIEDSVVETQRERWPERRVKRSPRLDGLALALLLSTLVGCSHRAPSDLATGVVERPAMLAENQPRPVYPVELLSERLTGDVRVRVTVLPTGRADSSTLEILTSAHARFTQAVEAVLPKLRFLPAEVGGTLPTDCHPNPPYPPTCNRAGKPGRKVAQQLELTFAFAPPSS